MTFQQLFEWQFANKLDDVWWLAVAGNIGNQTYSLSDIQGLKERAPQSDFRVLHNFFRDDDSAEWIPFQTDNEIQAATTPQRPIYFPQFNKFNATQQQIMNLAANCIRACGYTLTGANDSLGLLAFETGITFGSWSGASCSIQVQQHEPFWFTADGAGKQNVRGAQLLAIDFGETKSIVKRVITTMKKNAI